MKPSTAHQPVLDAEAPAPRPTTSPVLEEPATLMFERLARDPQVSVEKLERLVALQERILQVNRKAAFDAAFARMQPEIPIIDERGRIEVKGQLRSTFAPLEDIHEVVKPILARYGFAMRHRTEWPADRANIIRIVGILSHEQGHSEESIFEAPKDESDYRSDIQSMGSTVSYGRRYTTLDLLNISTRGLDKDGQRPEKKNNGAPSPEGYDKWLMDMEAVADNGTEAFRAAWRGSEPRFRDHLSVKEPRRLDRLRERCAQADQGAKR